jgi:hypothetical protein
MKTNKLLIAAVLAIAIGAPIAGFVRDINMAQPTTPAGERAAFFHGLADGPAANQSGLASLERADAWLNSPPLSAPGCLARKGRPNETELTTPFGN